MKNLLYTFALLLVFALSVQCRAQNANEITFDWRSVEQNYANLPTEFDGLYASLVALYKSGFVVQTSEVKLTVGRSISDVMREKKLFEGDQLPPNLLIYVCLLNPKTCALRPSLGAQSASIPSALPTTIWTVTSGIVTIPDLTFKPHSINIVVRKSASDSLSKLVVNDWRGCDTYDENCSQNIVELNSKREGATNVGYEGAITVLAKVYDTSIILKSLPIGQWKATNVQNVYDKGQVGISIVQPRILTREGILQIAPQLEQRMIPPARYDLHADDTNPILEGTNVALRKLIQFPSAADLANKTPTGKSVVAVFDTWVDVGHCLFANVIAGNIKENPTQSPSELIDKSSCGARANDVNKARDHGTHVVGLIASQVRDSINFGANPNAQITTIMNNPDNFREETYIKSQSQRLEGLFRTPGGSFPEVINLSFEYFPPAKQGSGDAFEKSIKGLTDTALFVVSAGNAGKSLTRNTCDVRPACFGGKNLITVGAVDLDFLSPKFIPDSNGVKGSNYGERVDIVAPGLNIISTTAGNKLGALTGTSQAAPLVTGAASLLYLFQPKLVPATVKNRLLYTADIFSHLNSIVGSGRLNVRRALKYEYAVMTKISGEPFEVAEIDRYRRVDLIDTTDQSPFFVTFENIRRLVFDPKLNRYTLFYNTEGGAQSGPLWRRFVRFQSPEQDYWLSIPEPSIPGQNREESVKLREIQDYTAKLQP